MNKKRWAIFLCLFLVIGYAALAVAEERGKTGDQRSLTITRSFAAKEIREGDTWKIYLNASDPEGNMRNLFVVVEQPGVGPYPLSILRIKKENQKELSGYIYLPTSTPVSPLNFITLTLTVWVQGTSGHFSQPAVFPLSIGSSFPSPPEAPPPGVFNEQNLGPVMVTLQNILGGDGHAIMID